jgi:NADH:ubiquinone oxidoreductase subunit 6 (subunit J)
MTSPNHNMTLCDSIIAQISKALDSGNWEEVIRENEQMGRLLLEEYMLPFEIYLIPLN